MFFGIRNIKNFEKPFCDFFEAKINFQELTKETQNFPKVDLQDKAERTICFSNELEKRGVKFIYVQVPTKMDLNNEMFGNIHSNNMVSFGNKNADELVDLLLQGGIEVL